MAPLLFQPYGPTQLSRGEGPLAEKERLLELSQEMMLAPYQPIGNIPTV